MKNLEEDIQNALSIPTRFFQKWTEINGGLQMFLQTKEKFRLSKNIILVLEGRESKMLRKSLGQIEILVLLDGEFPGRFLLKCCQDE